MIAGYRVPDLVRWFHELGGQLIHVVPVSVPEGSDLDVWFSDGYEDMLEGFREAVRMTFQAMDEGRPLRFGMAQEAMQLLRRARTESKHYCNAGVTTLTVAANGEIYPCFMFINKRGFLMGHVGEEHHLSAFARKPEHGTDFGCPGREFMMSGQIRPFQRDDALKRAVVDELLKCLDERLTRAEAELGIVRTSIDQQSA
jgi:radical SAM protein with 4Fe4S-binding SPASM domain